MAVYTTELDVEARLGIVLETAEANRLIEFACDDIDAAVGPFPVDDDGRKFDPAVLDAKVAKLLNKATAAQVEYRLQMGDDFMIEDQYDAKSGRDFSSSGRLRKVSPAAYSYLHSAGLLNLSVGYRRTAPFPNQNA